MSFTRLMWTQMCVAEADETTMRRNAIAARLGQAGEQDWKKHMGN